MGKVLAWVGIALVVWLAWRLVGLSRRRAEQARASGRAAGPVGEADAEDASPGVRRPAAPELMMQCAVCGVHLPGSEARFARGRAYCSDAHRDQDAAGAPAAEAARRDPS